MAYYSVKEIKKDIPEIEDKDTNVIINLFIFSF